MLNKKENTTIKIIDFGVSKQFKNDTYFDDLVGTPYYIAP